VGFLLQFKLDVNSFIDDNLFMYEIRHFLTRSPKDLFMEWRSQLRDTEARIAVDRRINRMELGNFGDHKFCRDGVWELRIDVGPGYRVYYAIAGTRVILLLSGGASERRMRTSAAPANTGWTGKGGPSNERQEPRRSHGGFV
jgi:putative addiction module killer protein